MNLNLYNNNNNNNNVRISRALFHVKRAQLRWTGANTKIEKYMHIRHSKKVGVRKIMLKHPIKKKTKNKKQKNPLSNGSTVSLLPWAPGALALQIIIIIIIIIIIELAGAIQDFLQSPHCAANCLQHTYSSGLGAIMCKSRATQIAHHVQITCNSDRSSCANHVQLRSLMCKSRAT